MNECDEKRETIADIVTGLRQSADSAFPYDVDAMNIYDSLADRIEEAWKREREAVTDCNHPGNAAAMREALEAYLALWNNGTMNDLDKLRRVVGNMRAALAAPARQCDVGTPDEKYQRWVRFCEQRLHSCHNCECKSPVGCTFKFGDMPYAEEGAADGKPE